MINLRGYFLGYRYNDNLFQLVQRWKRVAVPIGLIALVVVTALIARAV